MLTLEFILLKFCLQGGFHGRIQGLQALLHNPAIPLLLTEASLLPRRTSQQVPGMLNLPWTARSDPILRRREENRS